MTRRKRALVATLIVAVCATAVLAMLGVRRIERNERIDVLVGALVSSDAAEKKRAVDALNALRDREDIERLSEHLSTDDVRLRREVAQRLGTIGAPAVEGLLAVSREGLKVRNAGHSVPRSWLDKVPWLRRRTERKMALSRNLTEQAVTIFPAIGKPAVGPLAAMLKSGDAEFRRFALDALARMHDAGVFSALASCVGDSDSRIRREAVYAIRSYMDLAVVTPEAAAQALAPAANDAGRSVRTAALAGLGETGLATAADVIAMSLEDADKEVCRAAANALVSTRDARAVPAIVEALGSEALDDRSWGAASARRFRDARVEAALLKAAAKLTTDDSFKRAVAKTLMWVGSEGSAAFVEGLLNDADPATRASAAEARPFVLMRAARAEYERAVGSEEMAATSEDHLSPEDRERVAALLAVLRARATGHPNHAYLARKQALEALATYGGPVVEYALVEVLEHGEGLNDEAAKLLARFPRARVVAALIEASAWRPSTALRSLGLIADPRSVPALRRALELRLWGGSSEQLDDMARIVPFRHMRRQYEAGRAMDPPSPGATSGPASDAEIAKLSAEANGSDPGKQYPALMALAGMRGPKVEKAIAAAFDADIQHPARKTVVDVMASVARPGSSPALVGALMESLGLPDAAVRKLAAETLGRIGDVAAVPALERACEDDDAAVRQVSKDALEEVRRGNELQAGGQE